MTIRHPNDQGPVRVLIVGQTPPPYYGQALSIERILRGRYKRLSLFHVRMAFSKRIEDVGKFGLNKIGHLLHVIFSITYQRLRYRIAVLYYPPAGPHKTPMYRDLAILLSTRWLFKKTVFCFHMTGLFELYHKMSPFLRFLFRRAYFGADLAMQLSVLNASDGHHLRAKKTVVIPHGIEDSYSTFRGKPGRRKEVPNMLFVGIIRESKGVLVLLDACRILKEGGFSFIMTLVGTFEDPGFRHSVSDFLDRYHLGRFIRFPGILTDEDKWKVFAEADIFCFPTLAETFGMVVLEAMVFGLPVVATRCGGIPFMIEDEKSGFLVPKKDSRALAEKSALLLENRPLREAMGKRGREIYLRQFTAEGFWQDLEQAFLSIA
ncbi:MAG: glycosyltransferase family 4 protein [Deltaproteobacteria bacterium]|nr:glycosyltransferase family 4 protein [Deltaproteobacteria bacterium]